MTSYTINYSQKRLAEQYKNIAFLDGNTSISNSNFNLYLKISISTGELDLQARTFASNYKTHGYINFFKLLRCQPSDVEDKLYELYIYSFAKNLHNGLFYSNINERSYLGYSFRGHCSLYHILKSPNNSGMQNELMLSYQINLGSDRRRLALMIKLISTFKFLSKRQKNSFDALGTQPFFIDEYETYLNLFKQDHYASAHIEQGYGLTQDINQYPNGKLSVVEINNDNCASILAINNSPIMNCFVDRATDILYFIPVSNGKTVEFNPSFSFTKANQITLFEKGNDINKIGQYYNSYPSISKKQHLVCSEVYTITGIKCRSVFVSKLKKQDMTVKDIEKELVKFEPDKLIAIFNMIYEGLVKGEEVNLTRIFNLLLGKEELKQ